MLTSPSTRRCTWFSMEEIKAATNEFNSKVLGQGGEATVYFGEIYIGSCKTPVAVKHLKHNSKGFEKEIETVSKIHHPNIVSLVGYCDESDYKILVYEYMERGCLSDYLKKNSPVSILTWLQRLNICIDAARGLEHLHTETDEYPSGIIHRDVKPGNILLGENWVAKLSDFGMFKFSTAGQTKSSMTTNIKGTRGYYAPEYINHCRVTRKIDVYSFGVVLFEVLCRKMPWDRGDESYYHDEDDDLGVWARENVDAEIRGEMSGDSLKIFTDIIRRTLQVNPSRRPTMDVVVLDLQKARKYQESENLAKQVVDNGHSDNENMGMESYYMGDVSKSHNIGSLQQHKDHPEDAKYGFDNIIHFDDPETTMESYYVSNADVSPSSVESYTITSLQQQPNSPKDVLFFHLAQKAIAGVERGSILDALIGLLVGDVADVLLFQAKYIKEFRNQFNDMVQQLIPMLGYVIDSDKVKGKNVTVRTTLNALRELIYDADDLVLECSIHADYKKLRQSSFFPRISPRDVFFRYQTGKKLSSINRRIRTLKMTQIMNMSGITIGEQPINEGSSNRVRRWTSQIYDQSCIVGFEQDVKRIKSWIFPQNEVLHRVGIVGMGGLGKTTIAQKIFNDRQVRARFQERIWLSISPSFSEIDIMKRILKNVKLDDGGSDIGELHFKVHQALSRTTYLIVLDDVWSLDNGWWDRFSLVLPKTEGKSSCIIITSRIEHVVIGMGVVEARIFRHRLLQDDESWLLFCKIAFMNDKGICADPELNELGKQIVKNCHGVPLAIKTVGSLLASKRQRSEWMRIFDKFDGKLASTNNASAVMTSLQLSYDELPSHLKHCFLCFSVYPVDYEIKTEQLVRWWVGEGFVHDVGTGTAVEKGFSYLTELINRCLVEVVEKRSYDGRVDSCKVNGLVRDLTILIAKEEAFSSFSDRNVHIPTADSRRLGIMSEEMNFEDLRGNSKLRALLLVTYYPITFNRSIALSQVTSLRVLDFAQLKLDNVSKEDFWCWIFSQKRLVYLNLRGVRGLFEIPYSIGKLWSLQTLILAECTRLRTLPATIGNLFRLKVLDVGNCPELNFLPQGLRKFENLQELYGFKVPASIDTDGCQLEELRGLTKLQVLQVEIKDGSIIKEEDLNVLQHHDSLRILSINANNLEDNDILVKLDRFSPPRNVEEVYLTHYNGREIPQWMKPSLLPRVNYLCIEDLKYVTRMNKEFWGGDESTWKVNRLCMKYLPKLQMNWMKLKISMPSLRYMEISHCYMLQDFPCEVGEVGSVWKCRSQNS